MCSVWRFSRVLVIPEDSLVSRGVLLSDARTACESSLLRWLQTGVSFPVSINLCQCCRNQSTDRHQIQ